MTYELFISGIFHLIFSDLIICWFQTVEGRAAINSETSAQLREVDLGVESSRFSWSHVVSDDR